MRCLRVLHSVVLTAGLVLAGSRASAQATGSLSGHVTDAEDAHALVGATVTVTRAGRSIATAVTDDEGRFLMEIAEGSVIVAAEHIGYRPAEAEARVEPGRRTTVDLRLTPAPIPLLPIEIIGTAGTHRLLEGTATRLTPQTVRQIAPIGTQELLQHVPGISAFADDGIGNSRISIGIRGLNPRRSSRVLFLEDGIPIQPALYLYPNMYYNPPAERIARVEVIKGSAAIRHGPHTMGGVINYITSRPRSEFGGSSQLAAGTPGYLSLFTELGGWGSRAVQPEVQLLVKRGDGLRENNGFEQYNGTVKLNLLPDPDRVVYIKGNVDFEDSNATYTGLTEYSFRTDPDFNPKEHDNFRVFRSSLDVLYNHQMSERLTGDTRVYLNLFDRRWWREDDVFVRASQWNGGDVIDPVPPFQPGDLVRVGGGVHNMGVLRTFYVAGVEQSYGWDHTLFDGSAHLDIGARGHWERFIDDRQRGDSPEARTGVYFTGDPAAPETVEIVGQSHHYETTALSLFASERVTVGALTVTPGVRFEIFEQQRIDRLQGSRYEDKTSWVLLPGIGANYGFGDYHLFGGVHRGYTPPSSGTLRVVNFGADAEEGGLDLLPETSWNFEAGVRGELRWLAFEAAAFRIEIQDLVAAGRGTAFRNLGRAHTAGIELGATARPSVFWSILPDLNVSYTYLDTEVEEGIIRSAVLPGGTEVSIAGYELPYAPRHTLVAGLSTSEEGLSLRADVRYVSEVFTDFENIRQTYNRGDTGPVPAYTVIDASVAYRLGNGLTATLSAKNLLDEIYIGSRLHSNPGQPQANLSSGIIPGPRQQLILSLRHDF